MHALRLAIVATAIGITAAFPLPPCQYEDGSGQNACVWDAHTPGNGIGNDVVILGGPDGIVITL